MKEYEFRVPGFDPIRDSARIGLLREAILGVTTGFTEISPGTLGDLMAGQGVGYIISLVEAHFILRLEKRLRLLCGMWGLDIPEIRDSSEGSWARHCFFLVPKFQNPDANGNRPQLFKLEGLRRITDSLAGKLSHPVQTVYGEWLPPDSAGPRDNDISFMYILHRRPGIEDWLKSFIRTEILDAPGCDQETIYLSVGGFATYVYQP